MSNQNPQSGQPQQWWLSKHGTPTGPYDAAFIVERLRSGKIPPDTLACLVGGKTWKRLNESATFGHACTPSPSAPSTPPSNVSPSATATAPSLPQPKQADSPRDGGGEILVGAIIVLALVIFFPNPHFALMTACLFTALAERAFARNGKGMAFAGFLLGIVACIIVGIRYLVRFLS
jgi:hypothetical protein